LDSFLNDRRTAAADQVKFVLTFIDADDLVTIPCQARQGNRADISKTEYADSHLQAFARWLIRPTRINTHCRGYAMS
jgi:hypothetical protein